jgi:acylphosphatase
MAGDIATFCLRITGRVQGVGYRDWAVREAHRLTLNGWVRNRADGSVEVMVSGAEMHVETFIARASQGPRSAQVANVERTPTEAPTEPRFIRLPTL